MIWMSWRQFRSQALAGAIALLPVVAYLIITSIDIRRSHDRYEAQCASIGNCAEAMLQFQNDFRTRLLLLAILLAAIPGILGVFWGAPLVSRELEMGTHRLVWNQSVTRRRWLTVKLLLVGFTSIAVAGLASALLTWASSPVDAVSQDRFGALEFDARNIAPVAYAAFAFALGTVIGLLMRRTIPAMAVTLLVFAVMQFVVPAFARPHLMAPETTTREMTLQAFGEVRGFGDDPVVKGVGVPGAWVTDTSALLTADGDPLDKATYRRCATDPPVTAGAGAGTGGIIACLADLKLHVEIAYHPNDRYWTFQWLESALYLLLSGLLAAVGLWRIQRHAT
ncbi:ABC transporter permease subunit [Salinispora vitiensis]|uniref:ABC transporter permease subunit n=1 Tax=Salinispora vitiensis TaxID=999544 RepID=UPI000380F115|nr:ABC transporter permease subunit [Salinispora vitiensis]